jgi:hypothetical protein
MIGFFARGRIAWICSMVFGAILLVVGLVTKMGLVTGGGGAFLGLGLLFLILSLVTHGQTD